MRLRYPVLLAALLLAACGGSEGDRAYDEGRFRDAQQAFASDAEEDDASAVLLHNLALAALRAGDLTAAEDAATMAASRGDGDCAARAEFLRGNIAFARCETSELQARAPESEPFAFDVAIAYAESARSAWSTAATSRPDWPEARRNVERAILKLADLRTAREERMAQKISDPRVRPKLLPQTGNEEEADPAEEEAAPDAPLAELTPEEVASLLEKLAEKEKEKRTLRRTHRKLVTVEVEKDW